MRVDLRIATQDYEVTVNGLHAGPFLFDDPGCTAGPPCTEVASIAVTGDFLAEDIGWIDEVTLNRQAGGTAETLFVNQFSGCGFFRVGPGGILVSEPPRKLRTRQVGATLAPQGVQNRR